MTTLKLTIEVTIDEPLPDVSPLSCEAFEDYIKEAIKKGGIGFAAAMWKLGTYHDLEVKKLVVK